MYNSNNTAYSYIFYRLHFRAVTTLDTFIFLWRKRIHEYCIKKQVSHKIHFLPFIITLQNIYLYLFLCQRHKKTYTHPTIFRLWSKHFFYNLVFHFFSTKFIWTHIKNTLYPFCYLHFPCFYARKFIRRRRLWRCFYIFNITQHVFIELIDSCPFLNLPDISGRL